MDFSSDIDKAMVRATFRPSVVILATKLFLNAKKVIFAKNLSFLGGKPPIFNFFENECQNMFSYIILHQKKW